MEAGVLQQQHFAVVHFGDCRGRRLTDAVGAKGDRALDDVRDRGGDGSERIGLVRAALGAAEMGEQNDLAALVGDLRDGRRDALDARRIGHAAVFGRHVEVDAQEDAFSRDIGVVERAEWFAHVRLPQKVNAIRITIKRSALRLNERPADLFHGRCQISFAIATAVSAMRLEKPHSLSYQESTRTKLPSMTLVWSRWKTEERSSPLKSLETLGSAV